jgi:hypothetical protein
VADIAHEAIKRLKEANIAKWLFALNLTVRLGSPITTERNTATGLAIAPGSWKSCVGVNGGLATKHPKKHQNGHLPSTGLQQPLIIACYSPRKFRKFKSVLELPKNVTTKQKKSRWPMFLAEKSGSWKCHFAMNDPGVFRPSR